MSRKMSMESKRNAFKETRSQISFKNRSGIEEETPSLFSFLVTELKRAFKENIPYSYISEFPKSYMYISGCFVYSSVIAIFLYFLVSSYTATVNKPFISIDTNSGSCSSIPIPITGSFLADWFGNWGGSREFRFTTAIYRLELSNFQVETEEEYKKMFDSYRIRLRNALSVVRDQTLPENLLIWMSYVDYYSLEYPTTEDFRNIGFGKVQYLELTGSPSVVFDRSFLEGVAGGVNGSCTIPGTTTYDRANAVLTHAFNYDEFVSDPECAEVLDPLDWGYVASDGDVFDVNIDVESFTTALAVNYGVIEHSSLRAASLITRTFFINDVEYILGYFFDIRYNDMQKISCISNTTSLPIDGSLTLTSLCFQQIGNTVILPLFNHIGADETKPEFCNCSNPAVGNGVECNKFKLMASSMFFPPVVDSELSDDEALFESIRNLVSVVSRYPTYKEFNRAAYQSAFLHTDSFQPLTADFKTPAAFDKAYEFCFLPEVGYCRLFNFYLADEKDKTVSPFHFEVTAGSCANSVSMEAASWDRVTANPPVALTQPYFECFPDESDTFMDSVGIASGNVEVTLILLGFLVVIPVYYILLCLNHVPPPDEYSEEEREKALNTFLILLLRLRDGKFQGVNANSVLHTLTLELIDAAEAESKPPDPNGLNTTLSSNTGFTSLKDIKQLSFNSISSTHSKLSAPPVDKRNELKKQTSVAFQRNCSVFTKSQSKLIPTAQELLKGDSTSIDSQNPIDLNEFDRNLDRENGKKSALNLYSNSSQLDISGFNEMNILNECENASSLEKVPVERIDEFVEEILELITNLELHDSEITENIGSAEAEEGKENEIAHEAINQNILSNTENFEKLFKRISQLATVNIAMLLIRPDRSIFSKISLILTIHASIELRVDMREVLAFYGEEVAYRVGKRVFSLVDLQLLAIPPKKDDELTKLYVKNIRI